MISNSILAHFSGFSGFLQPGITVVQSDAIPWKTASNSKKISEKVLANSIPKLRDLPAKAL